MDAFPKRALVDYQLLLDIAAILKEHRLNEQFTGSERFTIDCFCKEIESKKQALIEKFSYQGDCK